MPSHRRPVRALKRGALVASANWPLTVIQASADALCKMVMAVPIVGGLVLVAIVVGAEPVALLELDARDLAATIAALLLSHPLVLVAFVGAVAVAALGGSVFVFYVKGGTVAILVEAERMAGPIEAAPFGEGDLQSARRFTMERFVVSAGRLFGRYVALGLALVGVYVVSAGAYLFAVFGTPGASERWGLALVTTLGFVAWITLVNWLYLLVQVAIAAGDCTVATAVRRVASFLKHAARPVGGVFLTVLVLVAAATVASLVASAALGLVAWVPFVWFAVWPLQLVAWLVRAVLLQYIALSSVGAYLALYRAYEARGAAAGAPAYPDPVVRLPV